MKKITLICTLFIVIVYALGCQEKHAEPGADIELENSPRHQLPGYSWLSDLEHYDDGQYLDSFYYYFNINTNLGAYDTAAAYLIAYGNVTDDRTEYDSLYYETCAEFYRNHNDKISGESSTFLCYYLGMQSALMDRMDLSNEWLEKALRAPEESALQQRYKGFTHFLIAQNYGRQNDFETAEAHLVEALNIFVEVDDRMNQGTVYMLLSYTYLQNWVLEQAESTLDKAMKIIKEFDNEYLISNVYSLYATLYEKKADTLGAIRYIDSLVAHNNSFQGIPDYFKAIEAQYLVLKHTGLRHEDSAAHYLEIARELSARIPNPDIKAKTLYYQAMFANQFGKSLENPEEAAALYDELLSSDAPDLAHLSALAASLYDYHQSHGNYKQANKYARFLVDDVRLIVEQRARGRLFDLEKKYEAEKKERTILLQKQKLEKRNRTIFILGAGLLLITAAGVTLIFWGKYRMALKEKSFTQNFASQLLTKTEEERKRIASELHDSVSNELVNLRHLVQEHNFQLKDRIDHILEEVRNISRNISPTLFDKIGLEQSIEQLTDRVQNQHNFFLTADISYHGGLDSSKELQVYRIIQEATTNTMKHAQAQAGKITITEDDKSVSVRIEDNGSGFDVEKMLEKGNCFGLLNITERAKSLRGTALIHSGKSGTTINVLVPK